MAANYDQLKDRIPRILTTRERFLEQQRCIVLEVVGTSKMLLRCFTVCSTLHGCDPDLTGCCRVLKSVHDSSVRLNLT